MQLSLFARSILTTSQAMLLASLVGCGTAGIVPTGSVPLAQTSLSSLTFGPVVFGLSSSAENVTVSNGGHAALDISSITLSGINANSFSESNNCPTSLAVGTSCTINAIFNPAIAGNSNATITIVDNASPSQQTIALSGTTPPVSVTVNPQSSILNSGQTEQITAAVSNASNDALSWSISPVGVGSISPSGLYTAPATIGALQTVTVTATSQADPTASSSSRVTLAASITASITPATATLNSGQTAQFAATITHALDNSVTWKARLGTITPQGLYTAPSNAGDKVLTDTITATSVEDPTKSAFATVTVSYGLVGWWPLNEATGFVAHDVSGQGNDGTWSGTPSSPVDTYYTTGVIGSYAGYFDGTDDSLTIGWRPTYQFTGPFTFSAWVKAVSSGTILSMQDGGSNGYNLGIDYGVIRFCIYAKAHESCTGGGRYPQSSPTWVYFTAVYDGTNISVYADGALVSSNAAPAPTASAGSLAFGVAQRGGYSNFKGSMDDIRAYNRALSPTEIGAFYNLDIGAPGAPTDLAAYPGDSQVGLSWNTPTQGATITDYNVNYRQSGTSTWSTFAHNPSVLNTQVVSGLTNGESYDFEVAGVNSAGGGLPSLVLSATPSAAPPAITLDVTPNVSSAVSGANLTFAATVTNALNPSVTWSARLGTITAEGVYTAPSNTGSNKLTDTITATSVQDPRKSGTATVDVSSGLVGWWPLNEGYGSAARDASGQGNNGTWSGRPSSSSGSYYTAGLIGPYAGYFDGNDNSVTIGSQPIYQFTRPFTFSAWVNTLSSGTIVSMQNSGNNGYNLGINYGAIRFCVYANADESCVAGGSYPLSSPSWVYFTAVFDGTNISVYANGAFIASNRAPAPTASTGALAFGVTQRGGYSNFTGSMDDIRAYNRALSASEIAALYNGIVGLPNLPTELVAYPGDSEVGLSWNTPTQGAIVTNYIVNYRQSGTSDWIPFAHNPSILNAQVVTGLTNGESYDFEVIPISAIGKGTASIVVSATPMANGASAGGSSAGGPSGGNLGVVASDDDEFVGPFSSWLNVKTDFGAVGDGIADDTLAFQYALNELQSPTSHASVLYIPAGTYKITSGLSYVSRNCNTYCTGKSIIGESPTNTILKWHGNEAGSAMVTLDGIYRMQFDRLTLDGSGAQITLINETMHAGCCYDGSNEYTDNVFENAAIGIQAGDGTVPCCSAETKVDRDTFVNLDMAGISLENYNALDWYVRYSTFEHNNFAVTNCYGAGGAMHLDHNLFEYNNVDSCWGNGTSQSYTYNTSYRSGLFLAGSPYANSSIFMGNKILTPQHAAISVPGDGPLTLIDNTIEGSITAAQSGQTVALPNGTNVPSNSYVVSMGNTYVSANPFSVQNVTYGINDMSSDLTSINDAVVPISQILSPLPMMPGPLPNYHRAIYDVQQGASGSTIQATIDQAIAQNNGNHPVVHIPWGQYSVSSTITIPSNSDVQIVGDNMQTIINWNGSTASPVFALAAPSHASIRNLAINAGSASAGILVEGSDQPGDRIYANFVAEGGPGSSHNLLVNGFDNTLIQMDDFGHGGLTNASSPSVLVIGGPLSQAGDSTPGYTGLFMGSSCCNAGPSYTVGKGATIVLTGFWYEQGGTQWLNLDGQSGNFIGYEDSIAPDSWGAATGGLPALTANSFSGTLAVANSFFQNSYLSLAGSSAADVLLLADGFASVVTPIVDANTNPKTQAATIFPTWVSGSINYTASDEVSPGTSRNGLIQSSLIKIEGYKDPPVEDLPAANEDVRLIDVIVNNGINSFDFEASTQGSSPASLLRSAGGAASSNMSAPPPSRPTSPWCKRINPGGPRAEAAETDDVVNPTSRTSPGTQLSSPADVCGLVR